MLASVAAACTPTSSTATAEDAPSSPGLVATFRGTGEGASIEVVRIDPAVALFLRANESPHPRLDSRSWSGRWQGRIQIHRAAAYRFSAQLSGSVRVTIAGREALAAESAPGEAKLVGGPAVDLAAGEHQFAVEFTKREGTAQLQLHWGSPNFRREPVPGTVLSHGPGDETPVLAQSQLQDRGRFLVEELSCVACHWPDDSDAFAKSLARREGPDLSRVGERAYAGWIFDWLESPQRFRPQAVMPQLFSADAQGVAERYAVARYLTSLGGPLGAPRERRDRDEARELARRGRRVFARVGCAVCHTAPEGQPPLAELRAMGSKTTLFRLAQYLQNPLAVDPSGRMPLMLLEGGEAHELAYFLCEPTDDTIRRELPEPPAAEAVLAAFQKLAPSAAEAERFAWLSPDERMMALGKRLLTAKSCTNCHRIAPGNEPLPTSTSAPAFAVLRRAESHSRGCLAPDGAAAGGGKSPRFALTTDHRVCLTTFLAEASRGAGSPAPTVFVEATLRRFHCGGCHARDGHGGLAPELAEQLREFASAEDAEAFTPPPLTGVGMKLRTAWLRDVLVHGRRARPWMPLRMPQFGEAAVGRLSDALAAADGSEPSDAVREFPYDATQIEAGRFLVGKTGFGCISCHDFARRPNTGTRGPDLASMGERVRHDWYQRWMDDAQRIQPGTRMPTVFPNGTSALKNLLGGDGEAQADAIWAYLGLGANLPPPLGLDPPRGLALEAKDRPLVIRTFMPDAGSRALAIGFPSGVSFAFDAAQCRLAYGWTGGFVHAGPIWNDRGGNPAGVSGPRFWTAPPGFAWAFTPSSASPPNWTERRSDRTFGAPPHEGELPPAVRRLRFAGYSIGQDGNPSFRYSVDSSAASPASQSAAIVEQLAPLQSTAGVGVARSFELRVPTGLTAWLLVGQCREPPRVVDDRAEPVPWQPESGVTEQSPDRHIVVFDGSTASQLVSLVAAPDRAKWLIRRQDSVWQVMLQLPASADGAACRPGVVIWSPYRNDPAMLRALLEQTAAVQPPSP